MAAKRKPVKKAAHSSGAKRVVPPKAKGKTMAAGRVRTAAKRRPSAVRTKPKAAAAKPTAAAAEPQLVKAKPAAPVSAKAKAQPEVRGATAAPKRPPAEGRAPVPVSRASAVTSEAIPSAEAVAVQPAVSVAPSTTPGEENGTPGLPVPIASFTI